MFKDFVTFDKMISPIIIKILFWIGVATSVLPGMFWTLTGLFTFLTGHGLLGLLMAIGGILFTVSGILWSRVICEILIVVFLIHDNLAVIRKSFEAAQPSVQAYAPAYAPSYAQPGFSQPGAQQPNIQS